MRNTPPHPCLRRGGLHAWILAAALLGAGPALASDGQPPDPAAESPAVFGGLELLPLPQPDLERLEPAVVEQLSEANALLESALAHPGVDRAQLAETFGEIAQIYHAYGFTDTADAAYRNAHRLAADDFRWIYLLGVLQHQAGLLEEAELFYRRALEREPGRVPPLLRLAQVYLTLNRLDEARELVQDALGGDPQEPAAHALAGEIALARGEHERAIAELEWVLERVPEADRYHYPLGLAYRAKGDLEAARRHLEQRGTVGVRPADPLVDGLDDFKRGERVYILRGRRAFRAGRYAEAAEAFRKAVEARPESGRARVNLASSLALAGDREGAVEELRRALELEPENATAHFNLGTLLADRGELVAALEHLQAAIEGDLSDPGPRYEMARILRRAGEREPARNLYRQVVELDPRHEEARLGEAAMLVGLERYAEALERLEEAHRLLPAEGRTAHALARLLAAVPDLELRDGERALKLASTVYEAAPTARHAATVAMALAELGRCGEARDWQTRALEAAREAGAEALVREFEAGLERYAAAPCRPPA